MLFQFCVWNPFKTYGFWQLQKTKCVCWQPQGAPWAPPLLTNPETLKRLNFQLLARIWSFALENNPNHNELLLSEVWWLSHNVPTVQNATSPRRSGHRTELRRRNNSNFIFQHKNRIFCFSRPKLIGNANGLDERFWKWTSKATSFGSKETPHFTKKNA